MKYDQLQVFRTAKLDRDGRSVCRHIFHITDTIFYIKLPAGCSKMFSHIETNSEQLKIDFNRCFSKSIYSVTLVLKLPFMISACVKCNAFFPFVL